MSGGDTYHPDSGQHCERCGYCVDGLAIGEELTCPECGQTSPPHDLWARRPWPSLTATGVRLCLPAVVLAAAFVGLGAFRGTREVLVWPVLPAWLAMAVVMGVVWPWAEAGRMGRASEPLLTRAARVRGVRVQALLVSLTAIASGTAVFVAML